MKESKELILALVLVGKLVVERVKDGVQLDDALAVAQKLLSDEKLKKAVADAVDGIDKVDDELRDFDLSKALQLAAVVPDIVAALQPAPEAAPAEAPQA